MVSKDVTTLEQLHTVAEEILTSYVPKDRANVTALSGELGAGKTAFTKELAKILAIQGEITSPTFVIMKSYPILNHPYFKTLVHIDAYRIESDDEMRILKFQDLLKDPTILMCIEWPEKIQNLLPDDVHLVTLTLHSDGSRTAEFEK